MNLIKQRITELKDEIAIKQFKIGSYHEDDYIRRQILAKEIHKLELVLETNEKVLYGEDYHKLKIRN